MIFFPFSTIFIISILIQLSISTEIICKYSSDSNWWVVEGFYYCSVQNNLEIESPENATITSIVGDHENSFTLDNVQGFECENKKTFYFPKNLEKFFKDLIMIDINYGPLKEIHQSDLKPFKKLKCLELFHNEIEVLENGLFDFNPELEMIWLSSNKIFHVDPEIFDKLIGKLSYFSLDTNECISEHAINDTKLVEEILKNVTKLCVNPKIYVDKILTKIERIEVKFQKKFETLEEIFLNFEKNSQIEQQKLVENEVEITSVGILITLVIIGALMGGIFWKFWKRSKKLVNNFENFNFE